MKKLSYLIIIVLISSLVLAGCSLLSNISQVPTTGQSGITYLTKGGLLSELVGLWSFDEGTGTTAIDSSWNSNDGTISGATYVTDQWGGYALSFNEVNDYVSVAQSDFLDMTSAYTLEAWVNVTDDLLPNKYRPILFRGTTNANDIEVYVQAVSKDLIVAHNRGNGGSFDYVGFVDPPLGTPFHLAVTFDGIDVQAYYDGTAAVVSQLTTAMTAPSDTDKAWWIGKVDHSAFNYLGSGSLHYFKGTIDEVRIWNTALSQSKIVNHAAGIYGFNGLMAPYAPPDKKAFKLGRTIPLKWQYTDPAGNVVDSAGARAYLKVEWKYMEESNYNGMLDEEEDAPGASGLQYDDYTMTWQFNWQTKGLEGCGGTYKIWITNIQTGQVNGPFLIDLR